MKNSAILEGEKISKKSILYLSAVGALKLFIGLYAGLTVLVADAVNTFADILTILGAYIGLKLSRKNSNSRFEFGYHKIETLIAFIISVSITITGIVLVKAGATILSSPPSGKYQLLAFIAVLLSTISSYKIAYQLISAGKKANSIALVDSGKDKIVDTISAVAVLISIVANYYGVPYVEGFVTLGIALIVLKVGILSAKESLFYLLDYWDDPKLFRHIHNILSADTDTVLRIERLQLRRAGTFIFGQAIIEIAPFCDLQELRSKLTNLQEKVKQSNPFISEFIIFTRIAKPKLVRVALPIKSGKTLKATLADNLAETAGYLFVELTDKKIKKFKYQAITEEKKNFVALATLLLNEKVNILVDNEVASLLYLNLRRTHHVIIYPNFSDVKKAEQLLQFILIDT